MEVSRTQASARSSREWQWLLLLWVVTCTLAAATLATMQTRYGWIMLAGCAMFPVACVAVRHPQIITALTVFLLFLNAPVVAMRYHGVPKMVVMLGPPVALIAVWLYQLVQRRETVVFPRAWRWAVGLLCVEILSAIFCLYPDEAKEVLKTHVLEGLGLFLILVNVVRTRLDLRQAVFALLLAGSVMGGLSLIQQLTGTHTSEYGGFAQVPTDSKGFRVEGHSVQQRAAGPVGEKNRYAQNMLMLIPLALLLGISAKSWQKPAYFFSAALILTGCILTFSRGAAVSLALLILVMAVAGYIRLRTLVALGLVCAIALFLFPQLSSRMESVGRLLGQIRGDKAAYTEELDGAIRGRATSMLAALRVTVDYPLLGVGPGNFPFYNREYAKVGGLRSQEEDRQAHCLYLHLAAESGLIGLTVFLVMVGVTLHSLHGVWNSNRRSDPEMASLAAGFALALIAYLLTGLFLHLSYIRFFWLVFALACCVPVIADREAELQPAQPERSD